MMGPWRRGLLADGLGERAGLLCYYFSHFSVFTLFILFTLFHILFISFHFLCFGVLLSVLKVGEGWGRLEKVREGQRRLEKVGEG